MEKVLFNRIDNFIKTESIFQKLSEPKIQQYKIEISRIFYNINSLNPYILVLALYICDNDISSYEKIRKHIDSNKNIITTIIYNEVKRKKNNVFVLSILVKYILYIKECREKLKNVNIFLNILNELGVTVKNIYIYNEIFNRILKEFNIQDRVNVVDVHDRDQNLELFINFTNILYEQKKLNIEFLENHKQVLLEFE